MLTLTDLCGNFVNHRLQLLLNNSSNIGPSASGDIFGQGTSYRYKPLSSRARHIELWAHLGLCRYGPYLDA